MKRLAIDTNVIIDALAYRGPCAKASVLLLALGSVGEFELWASSSQWTDLFYILSLGGKQSLAKEIKRKVTNVRKSVHVSALAEKDIDAALSSNWDDFEDACVYQAALNVRPDAIVTNNPKDFALSDIPVLTAQELFDWIEKNDGVSYEKIAFGN